MHNRTARDYQIRLNSLGFLSTPLIVDGMTGPKTRRAIAQGMEFEDVQTSEDLFHPSGINRIHWHWMGSSYTMSKAALSHYNDGVDYEGNVYDGGAPAAQQADYSHPRRIGVSHTYRANTGAIGIGMACMAGATTKGNTVDCGKYPLTDKAIDGMLKRSLEYCELYDIRISPWTCLTHAEVGLNIGLKQRGKWDIRVLPSNPTRLLGIREAGDILRERMKELR